MKEKDIRKMAHKLYLKLYPRIDELTIKLAKRDFNDATMYAFQIGLEEDITNFLSQQINKMDFAF